MNKRRLSYGLFVILAAAVFGGCDSTPPPDTAPQPSAAPADTGAPSATPSADPTPPPAPSADPTPPPPAKQAKDKFTGKFNQDFSGEIKDNADVAAKKTAGKKDPDGKKYNAAMDKAKGVFDGNQSNIEVTADTFTWSLKGKPLHTVTYKISKGDENTLTLALGKDGKKDLKSAELAITFSDDSTFSMKDPFSKKPLTLVFKK